MDLFACLFVELCGFMHRNFEGMMQMGNIAPRAGIEPNSIAFQACMLTTSPPKLPDITPPYASLCACLLA